jgi:hypothetical protein
MKAAKISTLVILCGLMCVASLSAQQPGGPITTAESGESEQYHVLSRYQHSRSAMMRFITSDEGRLFMQLEGHPLAKALQQEFGDVPPNTRLPRSLRLLLDEQKLERLQPPTVLATPAGGMPCSQPTGVRFNLEPRSNAIAQNAPNADFILSGVSTDDDLVVQVANDTRGILTSNWDGSASGYYVHNSNTADCSVQFEGGLPSFTFQGDTLFGSGAVVVKADNTRGVFFAADDRIGSTTSGIGLFRAAAADLLNPSRCPNGTHTLAQATSCWMQTPPVFLDQLPSFDEGSFPFLAVDERDTHAGKGAGDVYVLYDQESNFGLQIVACTNSLNCGPPATVPGNGGGEADIHVLPNGVITILSGNETGALQFQTCTPSGAPKPPICSTPTLAVTLSGSGPLENLNFPDCCAPSSAVRMGSGNTFTAFIVYTDCRNLFTPPPPPQNQPTVCLAADVKLIFSTDSGATWSKPVSVNTKSGHHLLSNVTIDASTGTVSIVYFSTEGDPNFHEVRVMLNQIAPGSTALGPEQLITTKLDAADSGPGGNFLSDVQIGAISRGTGAAGHSRLYTSFNSSAVNGTYNGKSLPELNNHISLFRF